MKKLALLSAACGAILSQSAVAQNATTVPVGAMTIDFPATGTSPATTLKYFSIPLHENSVFTGKPSSVSSNTLTFSGVTWTTNPSQFGATPSNNILRVLSGQQAGRMLQVISNSSNSLTLSITDRTSQSTALDLPAFAVTPNDTIEIVPSDTLAGLFGDGTPANPLLFTGGTNPFTADTIGIVDRATGKTLSFFFHTTLNEWRRTGSSVSQNSFPIYPDDALGVARRQHRAAAQLVLTGRVPIVAPLFKAAPGASYLTSLGVPIDISLQSLNLAGAWSRGNSLFLADTIGIYSPAFDRFIAYFQRSSDGTWRASASTSAPDVSTTIIPAGSAFGILERSNSLAGAGSFNSFPLPYTLGQ